MHLRTLRDAQDADIELAEAMVPLVADLFQGITSQHLPIHYFLVDSN